MDPSGNFHRREEAARQIAAHIKAMEKTYGPAPAVIVCGDFNTDPADSGFAEERTFKILPAVGLQWPWENTPLAERVTLLADGKFPDASFDGFLIKGLTVESCLPTIIDGVSDHRPVALKFEITKP
jgi:endonuclease/exonuclease/phosphatase family metal-dependent hydrolase